MAQINGRSATIRPGRAVGATGGGGPSTGGTAVWAAFGGRDDGLLAKAAASQTQTHVIKPSVNAAASQTQTHVVKPTVNAAASINNQTHVVQPTVNASVSINQIAITSDPFDANEDMYLDENAGTSSFGSATALLCKLPGVLGGDEQIGYMAWDLTGIATGTITAASLFVTLSTSAILGENGDLTLYTNTTKPFEEDTATWDSDEQPPGTSRQSFTPSLTTTPTEIEFVLNSTSRTNMLGNWFYLRSLGTGLLGISTITMASKESTDPPRLEFTLTI